MDPEESPFAIPPPPSKTSFNANPFASSTPSAFRSNFNTSSSPSINNSPYPSSSAATSPLDEFDFPAPPTARPPKKPLSTTTTRKKVSTVKSSLNKFSAPKIPDSDPSTVDTFASANTTNIYNDDSITTTTTTTNNNNNTDLGDKLTPTSPIVNAIKPRPLRPSPFNRNGSPVALLETSVNSPSRATSPNNVSSNSIGAGGNGTYSTSSSRPTSRPTSRPNSRVSNGRYHSRQLSSDSLLSFNAMIDKEDDMDDNGLSRSGHVSFVVSDPEHLRILEGEIEDPFSPSMSSIDPDTDAYLSNLMQQQPFVSIKNNSRGQSPAFKSRRQRQRQSDGDESFLDSTDDGLSDKEPNSKFRSSRTGTRTPTSPFAMAMTRITPLQQIDKKMANAGSQPSLDQILNGSQSVNEGLESQSSGLHNGSLKQSSSSDPSKPLGSQTNGTEPGTSTWPENQKLDGKFDNKDPTDKEHAHVDIVVQDMNDKVISKKREFSVNGGLGINFAHLDDDDDEDYVPFNQSGTEVLANEEMNLHESIEIHESHAQSFAEWMSSSAEISRLDISPPMGSAQFPLPSIGGVLTSAPTSTGSLLIPHGKSLLSPNLGDANVLTSSYTPAAAPSPETASVSTISTSPSATKRSMLLEKRQILMEDIMAKAKGSQVGSGTAEERKKSVPASPSISNPALNSTEPASESGGTTTHSVTFAVVDDVNVLEKTSEEPESTEVEIGDVSSSTLSVGSFERSSGLARRASGIMLSSRIRESTNLDAPRYSIREMEDMKKNVRMDLRIEITNEIREEYEKSAEQEAAIYQSEIEELKASLEKEKREKEGLKSILDEFEASLADFALSTRAEIQTIKEQNIKLTETKEETEEAFVLLKTRYDELRDLNSKHVDNENILRKAIETLKKDYDTCESRYENLKSHADAKLLHASQEMEQTKIVYDNEIAMLKAQLGRQEMQMRTLEQALEIKNKENEDLILFSEELIAKLS
ncbi:Transforming acidic coiled-coil-containing protein 3 [Entomortierella lignicola]|nr:Transforming acidic coiled-coil-containing protein 3 [Entomortierella lignicola]